MPGWLALFKEELKRFGKHKASGSEAMQTEEQENGVPALPATQQNQVTQEDNQKDRRMRYSVLDIVMTMALVSLVAAAAGPRFSKACSENRLSEMVDSLHAVRSRIECYRMANNGLLPGQSLHGGDVDADAFISSMTQTQAVAGGPWLKAVPANPFVADDSADDITAVNTADASPTGEEGTGWWFNAATGEFRACDSRFHAWY